MQEAYMQNVMSNEQRDIRRVAHLLADAARRETLKYFRGNALNTISKLSDGYDPVTVADRASETAMRDILAQERPDDGILGEEFDAKPSKSGFTWVLDPIDGTRGFVSGTPTWGVLISISDATGPIYGLIDQPYIGERFEGGYGVSECTGPMGTQVSAVSSTKDLSKATILTTFPEVGSEVEAAAFHKVADKCQLTRYGMDCYGYALLAAGQVDLVIEAGLQAYDICAPIAVVQAAGGIVTDWAGNPAHNGGRALAAATPELHAAALEVLQQGLEA